ATREGGVVAGHWTAAVSKPVARAATSTTTLGRKGMGDFHRRSSAVPGFHGSTVPWFWFRVPGFGVVVSDARESEPAAVRDVVPHAAAAEGEEAAAPLRSQRRQGQGHRDQHHERDDEPLHTHRL